MSTVMANSRMQIPGLWQQSKRYVTHLNLFPTFPPAPDAHELRNQLISTRLFLFLFVISFSVLLLYTSLVGVTQTVTIKSPTIDRYTRLYDTHSRTLTCPCLTISIDYDTFIDIDYTLHHVCSSVFVTSEWITYLTTYDKSIVSTHDFRHTATFTFQSLTTFCQSVNQTIVNRLSQFYATQYITASVSPTRLFTSHADAFVAQFISSTANDFFLSHSMIRNTTESNTLISALFTNYYLRKVPGISDFFTHEMDYNSCRCKFSSMCAATSSVFHQSEFEPLFTIPGLLNGCYVVESLLQADLRCFYNHTCLDQIQTFFSLNHTIDTQALDVSRLIRFTPHSTIATILDELMVERWHTSVEYERYFNACRPIECSYTRQTRNSILYILTTLVGLVGGLNTALRLIVPHLVTFLRKKNTARARSSLRDKVRTTIRNLNLFPSMPPSTDSHELRNQRISTRLFVFLLTVSFSILLLYTSLITLTRTVTVRSPTADQYFRLYDTHSRTLTCPCRTISINYETFVDVDYTFHQICSSVFVSDIWLQYLNDQFNSGPMVPSDIRATGLFSFQALRSFCRSVNQTINNRLDQFHSSVYVTGSIVPRRLFISQVEAFISQFISSTTTSFLLSIAILRNITESNGLVTGLLSNYRIGILASQNDPISVPNRYGNCTCMLSAACGVEYYIYNVVEHVVLFTVPDFYTGCYVVEALLRSSFRCFFNQTCIDRVRSFITSFHSLDTPALDVSRLIRFTPHSTIATILDELMVERWNTSVSYERYFNACRPIECSYTQQTRNSILYILTTLVGLVGGLNTALRLIVPHLVTFLRKKNTARTRSSLRDKVRTTIRNFNLFPSMPPSTDSHELRNQRISTRLFVLLLTVSFSILLLYASLITISRNVTIQSPTIDQYSRLYDTHSRTLTCPCMQISNDYEAFVDVDYTLHHVCSSVFVTFEWIEYVGRVNGRNDLIVGDFRYTTRLMFRALSAFCQLLNQTIISRSSEFLSSQYVTASVVPRQAFALQIQSFISQFVSSTTNDLLLFLSMIRNMSQSNGLLTGDKTNFVIYARPNSTSVLVTPVRYDQCDCLTSVSCMFHARIYVNRTTIAFFVPGFFTGCYAVEALLQSDLHCFFNQTCLAYLRWFFPAPLLVPVRALDASRLIRFTPHSTIATILDHLMVERWNTSVSYERYFNACHPIECSYTHETHNSVLYIVTTLVGLVGGLNTAFRLIVPRLVKLMLLFIDKCRTLSLSLRSVRVSSEALH